MRKEKILVTGACGQLGSELTVLLQEHYGENNVFPSDIRLPASPHGQFLQLDVLDANAIGAAIDKYKITQIYHLAAILSARGEQNPLQTWDINMKSLLSILDIMREKKLHKLYWPSSIAVFSAETPKHNTPQHTFMYPATVYGISKLAGEYWCKYYHDRYGVDVRSLRYPGVIGYKTPAGGGTTDYAVDIYFKAVLEGKFECFLSENTYLPMIYMPDALRATLELMEAESSRIGIRTSYNLGAMSFSPAEVASEIRKHIPNFSISYRPDFRQKIADSWTYSIDDAQARYDWKWKEEFDLSKMTEDMLLHIRQMYSIQI